MDPDKLLLESFQAAVAAADPLRILAPHLPAPPAGRTLVVGAGKAAASMALAVERDWPSDAPVEGLVVTRYGHGLATTRIRVVEAGHPLPDESGERCAREMLARVARLDRKDLLLALVSGGGSALLALAAPGLAMQDIRRVTGELLRCGATIQEINTVRKHLSAIQGGRLAAASRAPVLALIVSDVTGDDPTHIASGPCAPDPTTYGDALAVLARHRVAVDDPVRIHLEAGARGHRSETPKPRDPALACTENRIVCTAQQALRAAADFMENQGMRAVILSDSVTGEAREVAKMHAAIARQIASHGEPWRPPVVLLSGGECTVTLRGSGRGGRCAEFLLAFVLETAGLEGIHAIAADTDGIDGTEDNAGAISGPGTLARAAAAGIDAADLLQRNDAYAFFEKVGGLVVTGPTRTNVNDFRAVLVA